MEYKLNDLFGIANTDVIRGYFMMWVPAATLAFVLWALWRLIGRSRVVRTWSFGLPLAGIVTVLIPPVMFGLVRKGGLDVVLIGAVLGCPLVFLFWRWKAASAKVMIPAFALLYYFWFRYFCSYEWPTYDGSAGPILGFCAATAWGLYVTHPERRVSGDALQQK